MKEIRKPKNEPYMNMLMGVCSGTDFLGLEFLVKEIKEVEDNMVVEATQLQLSSRRKEVDYPLLQGS